MHVVVLNIILIIICVGNARTIRPGMPSFSVILSDNDDLTLLFIAGIFIQHCIRMSLLVTYMNRIHEPMIILVMIFGILNTLCFIYVAFLPCEKYTTGHYVATGLGFCFLTLRQVSFMWIQSECYCQKRVCECRRSMFFEIIHILIAEALLLVYFLVGNELTTATALSEYFGIYLFVILQIYQVPITDMKTYVKFNFMGISEVIELTEDDKDI